MVQTKSHAWNCQVATCMCRHVDSNWYESKIDVENLLANFDVKVEYIESYLKTKQFLEHLSTVIIGHVTWYVYSSIPFTTLFSFSTKQLEL